MDSKGPKTSIKEFEFCLKNKYLLMFRHEDALLRFAFRNTTLGVEATGSEAVLKSEEWVRHCCLNNTRKYNPVVFSF